MLWAGSQAYGGGEGFWVTAGTWAPSSLFVIVLLSAGNLVFARMLAVLLGRQFHLFASVLEIACVLAVVSASLRHVLFLVFSLADILSSWLLVSPRVLRGLGVGTSWRQGGFRARC